MNGALKYTSLSREISEEAWLDHGLTAEQFALITDAGTDPVMGVERLEGPPQLAYLPSRGVYVLVWPAVLL